MIVAIHQPNYIPWLGFFHKIAQSDIFVSLDNVPFTKNGFQNRNRIKTPNGAMWLTVPVFTKNRLGQSTRDVEINNNVNWQKKHWHSISQNYSKAPYFKMFSEFFQRVYTVQGFSRLVDLNEAIIKFIIETIDIETKITKASSIHVYGEGTKLLVEICKAVGADTYLSGPSGMKYLEGEGFKDEGILVIYDNFQHPIYDQLFGPFLPKLSIIDLMFNCGPRSLDILRGR